MGSVSGSPQAAKDKFNQEYINKVISLLSESIPKGVGGLILGFSLCFLSSPHERTYRDPQGTMEIKDLERVAQDLVLGDELIVQKEKFNFHFITDYDQRTSRLILFHLGYSTGMSGNHKIPVRFLPMEVEFYRTHGHFLETESHS